MKEIIIHKGHVYEYDRDGELINNYPYNYIDEKP